MFDETRFWNWKTNDVGEFIPVEDDFVGSTSPEIHTPVISPPSSPEPQHIATPNAPTEQGSPSSLPTSPESETSQPSVATSRPRRTINRPSWMEDYQLQVSGDDSSQIHLALFAGSDPVSFKDVVQDPKWLVAMDAEIKAIDKKILGSWQTFRMVINPLVLSGFIKQSITQMAWWTSTKQG